MSNDKEEALSLQLTKLLEKEVWLMRELLSEYKAEELFFQRKEDYLLKIARSNQSNLKHEISQTRRKRFRFTSNSKEDFNVGILKGQIDALNREIIDKIAFLKSLGLAPEKIRPKRKKQAILIAEPELND